MGKLWVGFWCSVVFVCMVYTLVWGDEGPRRDLLQAMILLGIGGLFCLLVKLLVNLFTSGPSSGGTTSPDAPDPSEAPPSEHPGAPDS
jgi:hypothetical protein